MQNKLSKNAKLIKTTGIQKPDHLEAEEAAERPKRFEKTCLLCNEPMLLGKGKIKEVEINGKKTFIKNSNQEAFWHQACRTKGRELVRKGMLTTPETITILRSVPKNDNLERIMSR